MFGAGRDDLVDPVENVVGECDVEAGEQAVEVVHGARPEERAGDARVSDRERHGEVGQRQAHLGGEREVPLDGVEAALVVDVRDEGGAAQFVVLALADAPGEQPCPSGPHTRVPIP
nr:hypothetical protein [Pseudofrankia sp. DC12]